MGILLLVLAFFAFIVYQFWSIFAAIFKHYGITLKTNILTGKQQAILKKYFPFYNALPENSKRIFSKRVARFIHIKQFIPRNMRHITEEMKVLISASAIQLTFGLPNVYLSYFTYILVYPDTYYSDITKKYHKGEVNPRHKAIVLSWKAFVEGYMKDEGLNLGLHEMAHALHLENCIRNHEFDFLPSAALNAWDQAANEEIEKIRSGGSFFRLYGSTDAYEFFAVAVENFFERPKELNDYSPKLYSLLSEILNQNPLLLYR